MDTHQTAFHVMTFCIGKLDHFNDFGIFKIALFMYLRFELKKVVAKIDEILLLIYIKP